MTAVISGGGSGLGDAGNIASLLLEVVVRNFVVDVIKGGSGVDRDCCSW